MPIKPLAPNQLRRPCDPAALNFTTTAELAPAPDIIGQPRATQAIEFGIDIASPGYNVFILGDEGTGRTTAIGRFLSDRALQGAVPPDWVYVHNFSDPLKPRALDLPPGLGRKLRDDMLALVDNLQRSLPQAFEQDTYLEARSRIRARYELERDAIYNSLQHAAAGLGLSIIRSPSGFLIVPVRDGKPLSPEAVEALPADEQDKIDAGRRELERDLEDALRAGHNLEKQAKDDQRTLDQQVAASVTERWISDLKAAYAEHPETLIYLNEVQHDIVEHVQDFAPDGAPAAGSPETAPGFRKYTVNLVVDHSQARGAPVVVELNPTYSKLFGRIEHETRAGTLETDFSLIRTGALHAANGGYLVLRARDVFFEASAWEALKRSLLTGFVRTEDIGRSSPGFVTAKSLDPEPIPLRLKVILIGPPQTYYDLFDFDDTFPKLFKVKADFAYDMPRSVATEAQYASFIAARCLEENLRPLDPPAVARMVEHGARSAGDQNKLSVRFGEITDLLREANYWAGKAGRELVTAADVQAALDHKRFRANRVEEVQRERILEGSVFIETQGEAIGQINALSVSSLGDHTYALPARVTVRTSVGHGGVSHLDRDTGLAGQIHNKGVLTLVSYFNATYGSQRSLSFSAQITFEQNYGGIEGDSASAAELCALLSSLSGHALKQSLAITGAVNQKGDLQPVGAVNEKIEGFFEICEGRGLTGEQGVVIPHSNVRDLMLNDKVTAAAEAGRFRIYAVSRIDEAIELFTGIPAGEKKDSRWPDHCVHSAVQKRLRELAKGHDRDHDEDESKKTAKKKPARKKRPPVKPVKRLPPRKTPRAGR